MAKKDSFDKTIQLRVDEELLSSIDEWMELRGHNWSRSEAIRTLVRMSIKSDQPEYLHINEEIQNFSKTTREIADAASGVGETMDITSLTTALGTLETMDSRLESLIQDRMDMRSMLGKLRGQLIMTIGKVVTASKKLDQ